jgi:hypothetical protein
MIHPINEKLLITTWEQATNDARNIQHRNRDREVGIRNQLKRRRDHIAAYTTAVTTAMQLTNDSRDKGLLVNDYDEHRTDVPEGSLANPKMLDQQRWHIVTDLLPTAVVLNEYALAATIPGYQGVFGRLEIDGTYQDESRDFKNPEPRPVQCVQTIRLDMLVVGREAEASIRSHSLERVNFRLMAARFLDATLLQADTYEPSLDDFRSDLGLLVPEITA